MNFLAHYALIAPDGPVPAFVLGNALPDLLPLADSRARFRPRPVLAAAPGPLSDGVLCHLTADTAFHHAPTFARAQAEITALLKRTAFPGLRVRHFFLSHVLAELALDAALLRADPGLAEAFYQDFGRADVGEARQWSEVCLGRPLVSLELVLREFVRTRYLEGYATDAGVAHAISRVGDRVRQDAFTSANHRRLAQVVRDAVACMEALAPALFAETRVGMRQPPTTEK